MTQTTIWQRLSNWLHGRHTPIPTLTVKDGVWLEQRDQGHYRLGLASDALEQIGDISFADLPIMVNDVLALVMTSWKSKVTRPLRILKRLTQEPL
ncbi:hypothetical protein L3X07_01495 [Levilactobacillus brevis]|nr:hypothetical protein [Levilactobacillus brevis]